MSERLPPPDPDRFPPLQDAHLHTLDTGQLLGRIHSTAGSHPTRWDGFRSYGPTGSRFDHHPPPPRAHPHRAVLYAAPAMADTRGAPVPVLRTCVAEVFRDRGAIELTRDAPFFALFRAARPLRLLDLADSDWVTLAGGNAAISSGLRATAREWARAVHGHYRGGDAVDGLLYTCSHIPAARSLVLFERASGALSRRPSVHVPLTHPALRPELEVYARDLRLHLLP